MTEEDKKKVEYSKSSQSEMSLKIYQEAYNLKQKKKYSEALDKLDQILQSDSLYQKACLMKGFIYEEINNYEKALENYIREPDFIVTNEEMTFTLLKVIQKLSKLDSQNLEIVFNIGKKLRISKKYKEAGLIFQYLIENKYFRNKKELKNFLVIIIQIFKKIKKEQEIINIFTKLKKEGELNLDLKYIYSKFLISIKKFNNCVLETNEIILQKPENYKALYLRGI